MTKKIFSNTQRKYLCHSILKWIVEPVATGCFGCQEYKWVQKLIRQGNGGNLHRGLLNMVVWLQPLALVQEIPEPEKARSCKNRSNVPLSAYSDLNVRSLNICCWAPLKVSFWSDLVLPLSEGQRVVDAQKRGVGAFAGFLSNIYCPKLKTN